jgi:hypothetical protein
VRKIRTLIEGPEWAGSRRKLDPNIRRFDEAFRFAAWNIAVAPLVNTTPFLSQDHRILQLDFPGVADVFVYLRIEPNDDACTLLWVEVLGGPRFLFRVG